MKKASTSPISRKAMAGFISRIDNALEAPALRDSMKHALNLYLDGEAGSARASLPSELSTAFEFLRQEVDKAIERSRKARMRARMRREAKEASANIPAQVPTDKQQSLPEPEKNPTEPSVDTPEASATTEPRENTVTENTANPDSSPRIRNTARQHKDNKNRPQGNPHGRRSDRRARNGRKVSVKSFRSRQNASTKEQP
ncbi:MAG: hypothetical protein NC349_05360 [Paenibacillus sp.]|nr:hypothetical protein [Paenibacillus sp.]